jgi:hypothetical protein
MDVTTKVERTTPPPFFENRAAYLSFDNRHTICRVMAKRLSDLGTLPWLTPVLGSGCTSSVGQRDALKAAIDRLTGFVGGQEQTDFIDGMSWPDVVRQYATDLAEDRLRLERGSLDTVAGSNGPASSGSECIADLFVASVLLTRLFYAVKATGFEAPRRVGHDDEVSVGLERTDYLNLEGLYIKPCRERLARVGMAAPKLAEVLVPQKTDWDQTREDAREEVCKTVATVVKDLEARLARPPHVFGLLDLQSMSELAWLSLTSEHMVERAMYPGWGDLLLDLSNFDKSETALGGRVGLPGFHSMNEAQKFIRLRYADATRRAYAEGPAADGSARSPLHESAARVLLAEHAFWRELTIRPGQPGEPPLASAFVTSFDMELELALLRLLQGKEKGEFVVAFPAFLYDEENRVARALWLSLTVDANAAEPLDQLLKPERGSLSVFSHRVTDYLENTSEHGPIVVHLAGCPLIQLPTRGEDPGLFEDLWEAFKDEFEAAAEDLAARLRKKMPEEVDVRTAVERIAIAQKLHHAVIINEHEAMLQNATDLLDFRETKVNVPSDNPRALRRGLSPEVAAGRLNWTRFWMLLGVQFADSAVRQRIATLVSLLPRGVANSDPSEHHGVAVNKVIGLLEQELLFWNGFEVVKDEAAAFVQDLDHFHEHLLLLPPTGGAEVRSLLIGADCAVRLRQ